MKWDQGRYEYFRRMLDTRGHEIGLGDLHPVERDLLAAMRADPSNKPLEMSPEQFAEHTGHTWAEIMTAGDSLDRRGIVGWEAKE